MSNLTTLTIDVLLVWHFPNLSISGKERLLEYFMDGLPSDNGAFGFLKPLLWAAAGDTSWWSCQELNVLFVIKKTQI